VTGLPIFMLLGVGGAGLVGGAIFAGASLYMGIPILASLGEGAKKLATVLPGMVGIGLGRNPSGATQQMGEAVAPVRKERSLLYPMLGVMVFWWALRVAGVYDNRPFWFLLIATYLVAYGVAMFRSRAELEALAEDQAGPELEWMGVTVPWQPEHLHEMDRALALDEVDVRAPA
jgi:branched-chain amino acid transport system permease protein